MARVRLPDVTLFVLHGGPETALTVRALQDTLCHIDPAEVLVFTSEPEAGWPCENITPIPRFPSANAAMRYHWFEIPRKVESSHMLHVEWDGWVLDGNLWSDEFLAVDYIGAPWPWHKDGYDVGNGLGLRSTKLMRFLADHQSRFPFTVEAEDQLICRTYRMALEECGFKFATTKAAARFSWERGPCPGPTFMFHGMFNWHRVLSPAEFVERVGMATGYARSRPDWLELGLC